MKKGIYIATNFKPRLGGVSEHTHQIVRHLTHMGERITVLAPSLPGDAEFDRGCGYPVTRVNSHIDQGGGWRRPFDRSKFMAAIFKTAMRNRPDYLILDQWTPIAGGSVMLASKLLRIPFFLFAHGTNGGLPVSRPHLELSRRWTAQAALRVFCVCEFSRSVLLANSRIQAERAITLLNGVDLAEVDTFLKARSTQGESQNGRPPTLLTVSRLSVGKGVEHVIEAMPEIVARVPNARYVVVGDGPDAEHLKSMAASSPVAGAITFTGPLFDDAKFERYDECDVFIMPSCLGEGIPLVYPEASSFGKPIIAGNTGGQAEAVTHGENGLIADPNDTDGVAEAAVRLLSDPEEGRSMGARGRLRVERSMSWKKNVADLLFLMHSALEAGA